VPRPATGKTALRTGLRNSCPAMGRLSFLLVSLMLKR